LHILSFSRDSLGFNKFWSRHLALLDFTHGTSAQFVEETEEEGKKKRGRALEIWVI
jgi:hypothetical protein